MGWRWLHVEDSYEIRKYSGNIDLDARTHTPEPCVTSLTVMWRQKCGKRHGRVCVLSNIMRKRFFCFFFFVDLWNGGDRKQNEWNRLAFLCTYHWGGVGIQPRSLALYICFLFSDFVFSILFASTSNHKGMHRWCQSTEGTHKRPVSCRIFRYIFSRSFYFSAALNFFLFRIHIECEINLRPII